MTKEELKKYDFILLMDKSGSMAVRDCIGGVSRWQYAQETVIGVTAKMAEYDQDGATVGFFAKNLKLYPNITGSVEQVGKLFAEEEPGGSTDTAAALKVVLDQYFADKAAKGVEVKPIIVVVVTDGQPDSKDELKKVIIAATQKMDADEEIGISFLQIGNDPDAAKFLKELDDDLVSESAKFDIVDTKTTEEMANMTITEVLIAALED